MRTTVNYSRKHSFNVESTLKPSQGDKAKFFDKWFVYSGDCWILDEILENVITKKNSGANKTYIRRNYVAHH